MLRRKGWLKKGVLKQQKTAAMSACIFSGVIKTWRTSKEPGEKWPWGSSTGWGQRLWEQGCPWAPYSGKEAPPSYPPKDLWTWRGTIWHLTSHQGHSTPLQTSCWVTNHARETDNGRLAWIYGSSPSFFFIMVMTHFLPTGAKGWL